MALRCIRHDLLYLNFHEILQRPVCGTVVCKYIILSHSKEIGSVQCQLSTGTNHQTVVYGEKKSEYSVALCECVVSVRHLMLMHCAVSKAILQHLLISFIIYL